MDNLIRKVIPNKKNDHTKRYGRGFFNGYFFLAVFFV